MCSQVLIKDTTVLSHEWGWMPKRYHLYVSEDERLGYRLVDVDEGTVGLKDDWVLDGKNRIYMPSLFNAHTHLPMILFRGLVEGDMGDKGIQEPIANLERKLSVRDVEIATMAAGIELIRGGSAHVLTSYYYPQSMERALRKLGVFAMIGITIDDDPPISYDCLKLAQTLISKQPHGRWERRYVMAPHSIYRCSDETLRRVKELAERHDAYVTIHASETRQECVESWRRFGRWPVEHLYDIGLLGPKVLLAHTPYLTKMEIALIKESNARVVHCPASNMKLASGGTMPLVEMLANSVEVLLGTDSPAHNNSLSMVEEMRFCGLVHKAHRWEATAIAPEEVLNIASASKNSIFPYEAWVSIDKTSIKLRPHIPKALRTHIVFSGVEAVDLISPTTGPLMINRVINTVDEEMVMEDFDRLVKDYLGD